MKTTRKGTVKLEKGETRISNFVFKEEPQHVKIQDINSSASWRLHTASSVGYLLKQALKEHNEKYLQAYASVIFQTLHTVPTPDFLKDEIELTQLHIEKNPQYYGKEAHTEEPDSQIIKEEQQLQEEIDKLKSLEETL